MSAPKQNCLIVLSAAIEGVSAQSFIQSFTLVHTAFNVQLASPAGNQVEYVQQDDNSRRWLSEFRTKAFSIPISLESIDPARYSAVLIPNAPGAMHDLPHSPHLAAILNHFILEKKPICAIGVGVAALVSADGSSGKWNFTGYSMTSTSVMELARLPDFSNMPLIPEDFLKVNGATYSCSEVDAVHIVMDRHLITGQNDQSTLIAVQNLILLCNQRQSKSITR